MASQDLTLSDIRKRALGYLDSSDSDNHYGSLMNDWINDAQQEMVDESEGVEDVSTSIKTAIGNRSYNLPNDYTRIKLVLYNGYPLIYEPIITMDFFSTGTGQPDRYAIWNNQIILGPLPPSDTQTLTIYFVRAPALLVNDTDKPEIPNRFRHYMSKYAAAQAFIADGEGQDAQALLQDFEKGKDKFRHWAFYRVRQFKSAQMVVNY